MIGIRAETAAAIARITTGAAVIGLLLWLYVDGFSDGWHNPFDYFGYFTNLTSLLTSALLIATGALSLGARTRPAWLDLSRAIAVSCMIVVGVIYNTLVPGTGSAPPWASVILHAVFPILVLFDWIVVRDRRPLPWSRLWHVLVYPVAWLAVVLVRGTTDGWVPYGFLLPENGLPSLLLHIGGLLATLLVAAAAVWGLSRIRLFGRRAGHDVPSSGS